MTTQNRPPKKNNKQQKQQFQQMFRNSFFPAIFVLIILYFLLSSLSTTGNEIPYSKFKDAVRSGKIASVLQISKNLIEGEMIGQDGKKTKFTTTRVEDPQLILGRLPLEASRQERRAIRGGDEDGDARPAHAALPVGLPAAPGAAAAGRRASRTPRQ